MRVTLASIALHDRVEHILPAVGAVDIAGTQRAAFQITELIEHEQRVITGVGVMAETGASSGGRMNAICRRDFQSIGRSAGRYHPTFSFSRHSRCNALPVREVITGTRR